MTYTPQVFIGTLFCGEGDIQKCCEAIAKQDNVTFRHDIIANLPEKEAHNKLWSTWRKVQTDFDAFIKVDADTVLMHENVISEFMKIMTENPDVTGIQAPLKDYFTNSFINGLNCFKNTVVFNDSKDDLFCDRGIDVNHKVVLKADRVPDSLRPAGLHCYHSSEQQAYHFGLHRALKGQVATITQVKAAFVNEPTKLRGLALIGANDSRKFASHKRFNYTDSEFSEAFESASKDYDRLINELFGKF